MTWTIRPALCAAVGLSLVAVSSHAGPPAAPPASKAGQLFTLKCRDVQNVTGSDTFTFVCEQASGGNQLLAVAHAWDSTGAYYSVTDPASAKNVHEDDARLQQVSSVVNAFMTIKASQPSAPVQLNVVGIYSRVPTSKAGPVAMSASIER